MKRAHHSRIAMANHEKRAANPSRVRSIGVEASFVSSQGERYLSSPVSRILTSFLVSNELNNGGRNMGLKKLPKTVSSSRHQDGAIKKPQPKKLSSLQQRMAKKLDSAKFRMLNESLYSTTGAKAKSLMEQSPELFHLYHTGYVEQVKRWPRNPLDDIIKFLRTQSKSLRIVDLGCGEARLSREVPQQVKSFDLVAANDNVIACDIARLPLPDSSVDVAVFCLSLMGTNYSDFLHEAYRVVVPKGIVIVAEVASRFPNHNPQTFTEGVESIGFHLDRDHPLLTELSGRENSAMRRRRKTKGRKWKKYPVTPQSKSMDETAFFVKFVFMSRKGTFRENDRNLQKRNLPKLAACVYKKR